MGTLTALRQSIKSGEPAATPEVTSRTIPDFSHAVWRFLRLAGAEREERAG